MKRTSLFFAAFLLAAINAKAGVASTKVIYGNDDRADIYQVDRVDLRELADSTAAIIPNNNLLIDENGNFKVLSKGFGDGYQLCKDERFYEQKNPAICSSFLVGDDMVATAGHCVDDRTCKDLSFVFGFQMKEENTDLSKISKDETYHCKSVLSRELTRAQDYALVKLDRPVRGHRVLALASQSAKASDDVFVIGYPAGLPAKVAGGARVRSAEAGYFVANMDTYGGNSGSAVFSAQTNEVVGILVRGEQDFVRDTAQNCIRSNKCPDGGCRGEDSTHILFIKKAIDMNQALSSQVSQLHF